MKKILFCLMSLCFIFASCNRDDKPITLSVDKAEITANNEDFATFTVLCEGKDVTNESLLFLEGQDEELGSNIFSTAEAGKYTFYAYVNGTGANNSIVSVINDVPTTGTSFGGEPVDIYDNESSSLNANISSSSYTLFDGISPFIICVNRVCGLWIRWKLAILFSS